MEEIDEIFGVNLDPREAIPKRGDPSRIQIGGEVLLGQPTPKQEGEHEVLSREIAIENGKHAFMDVSADAHLGIHMREECGVSEEPAGEKSTAQNVHRVPPPRPIPYLADEEALFLEIPEFKQTIDGLPATEARQTRNASIVALPPAFVKDTGSNRFEVPEPELSCRGLEGKGFEEANSIFARVEAEELEGPFRRLREGGYLEAKQVVLGLVGVHGEDPFGIVEEKVQGTIAAAGDGKDSISGTDAERAAFGPPVLVAGRIIEGAEKVRQGGATLLETGADFQTLLSARFQKFV